MSCDISQKEQNALKVYHHRYENYRSEKAREYALNFKPTKNSYYISTYPKSGTTLTQQVILNYVDLIYLITNRYVIN